MRNARSAEKITELVFALPKPQMRYEPDEEIRFTVLQEVEIRFCARLIVECEKLDDMPWDALWRGHFAEQPTKAEIEEMVEILKDDAIKWLGHGYDSDAYATTEGHCRMVYLEDCVTLDPYKTAG